MKKIFSVILALVLAVAALPMIVNAEEAVANNVNAEAVKSVNVWMPCGFSNEYEEDVLCIELGSEFTKRETPDISIHYITQEGDNPVMHTYTEDEMIINEPCDENGNVLEVFLCSNSVDLFSGYVDEKHLSNLELCIGENSFSGANGMNKTIIYELSNQSVDILSFNVSDTWENTRGKERSPEYSNCAGDNYVFSMTVSENWSKRLTKTVSDKSKLEFKSSEYSNGILCDEYLAVDTGRPVISYELNKFIGFSDEINITTRSAIYSDNLGECALAAVMMPVMLVIGMFFMLSPITWLPGLGALGAAIEAIPDLFLALFGVIKRR